MGNLGQGWAEDQYYSISGLRSGIERVTENDRETTPNQQKHKEGDIDDYISSHTTINNPFKIFSHCYCYIRGLFKNTYWDILIVSKTCAREAGRIMLGCVQSTSSIA